MNRLPTILIAVILAGCQKPVARVDGPVQRVDATLSVPIETTTPFRSPPRIESLAADWPNGSMAVWGSLARGHHGEIVVGVSVEAKRDASATLLAYDPRENRWSSRGHVTASIETPKGVSQNKIHTRFHPLSSGDIVFASMDESGELDDGSLLPTYGSYLWKVDPANRWTLLKNVPEGIIASAAGGDAVWFLGYFGHVVYRYDVKTEAITQTRVGATGGHVSRNFVVDDRGHAFVPRVRSGRASLVELNPEMDEVAVTPLTDYDCAPNADSHGIVSWARLTDGTLAIVTDGGRLYTIDRGKVTDRGLMHPAGQASLTCLISPDGAHRLVAIGHRKGLSDWVEFDLTGNRGTAKPITIPVPDGATNLLVYGSGVRDQDGRWYVAGAFAAKGEKNLTPAIWRIE